MSQNDQNNSEKKPTSVRSVLGTLFSPRLDKHVEPLRFQTRMFSQLVAMVFMIYGLFPKDHPFLRNMNEQPMSLFAVISTAYSNLSFKRENLLSCVVFFAVLSMMIFGVVGVFIAVMTVFSTQAHAESAFFTPGSTDLAAGWLKYLFRGGSYYTAINSFTDINVYLEDPFTGSVGLQEAFISALAFYSNAILLVAGILLFYHLVVMVADTAHHGEVMGKNANKIWAPIRLVFAIGLLVPINSGLNTGQYIVIRMAELGSGLATQTWNIFLTTLASYQMTFVGPSSGIVEHVALDLIRSKACTLAWNNLAQQGSAVKLTDAVITNENGKCEDIALGGITGSRCSFSGNSVGSVDVCGSYFIPGAQKGNNNALSKAAAEKQKTLLNEALNGKITTAAKNIEQFINSANNDKAAVAAKLSNDTLEAISDYQQKVNAGMQALADTQAASIADAIGVLRPYGWALAGAFVNTIDRVQGNLAVIAVDSMPRTSPPIIKNDLLEGTGGEGGERNESDLYRDTASALKDFSVFTKKDISKSSTATSCAMMTGLTSGGGGNDVSHAADHMFSLADIAAVATGVWTKGIGDSCGSGETNTDFRLGVRIGGRDPLSQMSRLGHALLNVAFTMYGIGVGSELVKGVGSAVGKENLKSFFEGLGGAVGGLSMFLGMVFLMMGFTLAFIVPLMPFLFFFFAVLSWVVAVIEAVIAVPLIALAQLNPQGEGLPGQAKKAFYYIFNIFLRPVLTVFGLMAGLIVFYISLSYLNFAYGIAVSGAGGSAYGHAVLSKIIYSILYVIITYILANHSFKLVEFIPANAMKWMNQDAQAMHQMGDTQRLEQLAMIMSSTGMMKMGGAMGGLANHASQMGTGLTRGVNAKLNPPSNPVTSQLGNAGGGAAPRAALASSGAAGSPSSNASVAALTPPATGGSSKV